MKRLSGALFVISFKEGTVVCFDCLYIALWYVFGALANWVVEYYIRSRDKKIPPSRKQKSALMSCIETGLGLLNDSLLTWGFKRAFDERLWGKRCLVLCHLSLRMMPFHYEYNFQLLKFITKKHERHSSSHGSFISTQVTC